jgi:hypothetical protein
MQERRRELAPPAMAEMPGRAGRRVVRRVSRGLMLLPIGGAMAAYAVGRKSLGPATVRRNPGRSAGPVPWPLRKRDPVGRQQIRGFGLSNL